MEASGLCSIYLIPLSVALGAWQTYGALRWRHPVGVAIGLLTLVLPARQHYNNPGLSPVFDGPASDDEALWPILVSVASAAGAALRRFFLIRVLVSLLQFFLYIPLSLACLLTRAALRLVMWVVRPALHLALGWARALPLARQTQWIWVLLIICSIMIAVRMRAPDPPRPRTKRTLPFPTRCPKGRWFSCTRLATDRPHVIYDPHARRVWPPVAKAPAHDVFSALLPFLTWRMGAVILTSGPDSASTLATGASSEPLTAIARSVSFLGIPTDVALRVVPLQEGGCRVEFQSSSRLLPLDFGSNFRRARSLHRFVTSRFPTDPPPPPVTPATRPAAPLPASRPLRAPVDDHLLPSDYHDAPEVLGGWLEGNPAVMMWDLGRRGAYLAWWGLQRAQKAVAHMRSLPRDAREWPGMVRAWGVGTVRRWRGVVVTWVDRGVQAASGWAVAQGDRCVAWAQSWRREAGAWQAWGVDRLDALSAGAEWAAVGAVVALRGVRVRHAVLDAFVRAMLRRGKRREAARGARAVEGRPGSSLLGKPTAFASTAGLPGVGLLPWEDAAGLHAALGGAVVLAPVTDAAADGAKREGGDGDGVNKGGGGELGDDLGAAIAGATNRALDEHLSKRGRGKRK